MKITLKWIVMMAPRLRAESKNAKCVLLLLAVLMNPSDSAARRGQSRFQKTGN